MVLSYNLYNEILLIHTKTKLKGVFYLKLKENKKNKLWSQISYRNVSFALAESDPLP